LYLESVAPLFHLYLSTQYVHVSCCTVVVEQLVLLSTRGLAVAGLIDTDRLSRAYKIYSKSESCILETSVQIS